MFWFWFSAISSGKQTVRDVKQAYRALNKSKSSLKYPIYHKDLTRKMAKSRDENNTRKSCQELHTLAGVMGSNDKIMVTGFV